MDIKELQPILALLKDQKEDLLDEMKAIEKRGIKNYDGRGKRLRDEQEKIHNSLESIDKGVKTINGRVRAVEVKTASHEICIKNLEDEVENGKKTYYTTVDKLKIYAMVIKTFNWMGKYPKISIAAFFGIIVGLQSLIMLAIEKQWIGKFIDIFN